MPQAADIINLTFLSESERELILEVLQRDEDLRQAEEQRIRKLKTELQEVKRKGAKRGSGKYSQRICARCLQPVSAFALFFGQCQLCNHEVCRSCRMNLPDGSWLCCVCAKESDLKKMTGDWFFDQRVNRFSTTPGHDLVKVSLKKKEPGNKPESTPEVLVRSNGLDHQAPPVPQPRLKNREIQDQTNISSEIGGSIVSRESSGSKSRSDTESAERSSLSSSKATTESGRVTPKALRREKHSAQSSSAGSSSGSSSTGSSSFSRTASLESARSLSNTVLNSTAADPDTELDVDRLFKKSVRRVQKNPDLRDGGDSSEATMGNRSRSVPVLDIQEEEEEEEEEDIDSLVSFHKRSMASSSYSLNSSRRGMGSMMSIYSEAGDFDNVDVSGDVVFSLSYNKQTQNLQVFINLCQDLAYAEASRQLSNPYVKCYLLPDKSRQSKRKTSIKRNTVNPVYRETLKYSISFSQLFTRSMLISVWHHGRFSRNVFLGEVEVPLNDRDLESPQEQTLRLRSKASSSLQTSAFSQYRGELVISLKYITSKKRTPEKNGKGKKSETEKTGELHVLIKEAKNLTPMKTGDISDSFVKGSLFPSKSKSSKKTAVVKRSLNPHYNHTFIYLDVVQDQLKNMCLELTVWDKEKLLSHEFLGGVRLSSGKGAVKIGKEEVEMDSVGEEVSLWEKMMQYPDSWAEGTLPLRSSMKMDQSR